MTGAPGFLDRADAGRRLGELLAGRSNLIEPLVVGLPRGGVPVAAEVAQILAAPLDVILVRKLGVPGQPELAMGAIGEDYVTIVDAEMLAMAHVSEEALAAVEARERGELAARSQRLRGSIRRRRLRGRTIVIVDDGLATGSTARAACSVARAEGARRVVLAVPVAPAGWTDRLGPTADDYVAVYEPLDFGAVGQFYADFTQVSDDEVVAALTSPGGTR
ncbi:MAG: phosphoribosyltransferase family protein [Acidimicrobiales bacterium]